MTQTIRQEIVTIVQDLPDELLAEALILLNNLTHNHENISDQSSEMVEADFDQAMNAYQVISEKYKNALRELA
ncbi:MAG: hypothetical protein ACRC2J_15690 [Microcoleaceae cyanobacterium]